MIFYEKMKDAVLQTFSLPKKNLYNSFYMSDALLISNTLKK